MPISHHGACRPAAKNSVMLRPARRAKTIAGTNVTPSESATMIQSSVVKCMDPRVRAQSPGVMPGRRLGDSGDAVRVKAVVAPGTVNANELAFKRLGFDARMIRRPGPQHHVVHAAIHAER